MLCEEYMKYLIVLLCVLVCPGLVYAEIHRDTSDYISIEGQVLDSAGIIYNVADSVAITVKKNGHVCVPRTWFNAGDAEADSVDGVLTWTDKVANIDADSGNGGYEVLAEFYDYDLGLYDKKVRRFYKLAGRTLLYSTDSLYAALDLLQLYLDASISSRSGYNPLTDSTILDFSILVSTPDWITATAISEMAKALLAQRVRDSIMETDTADLTTEGTFGEVNSGRNWFDPGISTVVPSDTNKAGDTLVTNRHMDSAFFLLDVSLMWLRDSLPIFLTIPANGNLPWAIHSRHSEVDTLWIGNGLDTSCGIRYPHPGGAPGDPPTETVTGFIW
jgi:hypothetical protein